MADFASRVLEVVGPELDEIRDRFKSGSSTGTPGTNGLDDQVIHLLNSVQSELRQNCAILEGRVAKEEKKPKSWRDVPKWIWQGVKDNVWHLLDVNNDGDIAVDDLVDGLSGTLPEALRLGLDGLHLGWDVLHDMVTDIIRDFNTQRIKLKLYEMDDKLHALMGRLKDPTTQLREIFTFLREWREADGEFQDHIINALEECCVNVNSKLELLQDSSETVEEKVDVVTEDVREGFETVERLIAIISPTTTANNTLEILSRVKRLQSDTDQIRGLLQTATNYSCL